MQHTQNYQLPQWEMSDRILMEDFNGAMNTLDTTIAEVKNEAATGISEAISKAEAALSQKPYVFGSYSGTGAERTFSLGFRPKAVFIAERCAKGETAVSITPSLYLDGIDYGVLTFLDDGFKLVGQPESEYRNPHVNYSTFAYSYAAFR